MNSNEATATARILRNPEATRAQLVEALKVADAYKGKSKAGVATLRRHALTVADELEAAHPAEPTDDSPRCSITGKRLNASQKANAAHIAGFGENTIGREAFSTATGCKGSALARRFSPSGWQIGGADAQPSYWNQWFVAAIRADVECTWSKGRTVTFRQLSPTDGEAQRQAYTAARTANDAAKAERRANRPDMSQSPSRLAASAKPVNPDTVAKVAAAIRNAASTDGVLILTAMDLALAGLGKGWTRIPTSHLDDATHVKARTLAAAGFTGRCSNSTLVLTALTIGEAKIAS